MDSAATGLRSVAVEAYERGFADGVSETLSQLRMRFNLSLIEGLQDFVNETEERVNADA